MRAGCPSATTGISKAKLIEKPDGDTKQFYLRVAVNLVFFDVQNFKHMQPVKDCYNFHTLKKKTGAGDGIRTHDPNLGKVVLYP